MMINTVVVPLPNKVRGFTTVDNDDEYTIVLNAKNSNDANRRTYLHEIEHIKNGDIRSVIHASDLENLRH